MLGRSNGLDTFEVHVEVTDTLFDGWMDDLRAFERRVTEELRSALLVRPKVKLVEPGKLERSEGKARRVIDNRPVLRRVRRPRWRRGARAAQPVARAYVKAGGASPRFAPPAVVKVDLESPLSESSGLLATTSGRAARGRIEHASRRRGGRVAGLATRSRRGRVRR